MIIREAGEADCDGYSEVGRLATEILRRVYRPRDGASGTSFGDKKLIRLVAVEGEKIVGTVRYYVEDDRIHLIGLMVHPDFHRRGLGKAMIEHLVKLAEEQGLKKLSLYTIKETGNVMIFEKMGFSVVREEVDVSWAQSDMFERLTETYMERIIFVSRT
jgi:ribosomal protein S18 acetylase RimI-like enzyme